MLCVIQFENFPPIKLNLFDLLLVLFDVWIDDWMVYSYIMQIHLYVYIYLSKYIHLNNCDLFSDNVKIHRGMNSATTRAYDGKLKKPFFVVWIFRLYMLWTLHNFSLYRLYIIIIPYFAQNIFQTKKHTNGLLFLYYMRKRRKNKMKSRCIQRKYRKMFYNHLYTDCR